MYGIGLLLIVIGGCSLDSCTNIPIDLMIITAGSVICLAKYLADIQKMR